MVPTPDRGKFTIYVVVSSRWHPAETVRTFGKLEDATKYYESQRADPSVCWVVMMERTGRDLSSWWRGSDE
jgi:hypothetical protein